LRSKGARRRAGRTCRAALLRGVEQARASDGGRGGPAVSAMGSAPIDFLLLAGVRSSPGRVCH
jgi:hypothetical protein